jgi:hypothetical protein
VYKKRGRHNIEAESINNEEQFASQFFNFLRKHPELIISQVSVPQINLEVGTATPQVVLALSGAGSTPNNQKYPVEDINEPTPGTLLYVKGRMLRTIKVANGIVMATRIMHGQHVSSECAVVEVTTIREGREFEDLDYPDEEEGIEKLKDAKGNFIIWPHKDISIKARSSLIVSPQSREDEGTPTSQSTIRNMVTFTPPYENPSKTTPLPKIQHLHNLLSIILLSIILLHMVILQSLLLTLPLLFKIYQPNKLLSNVLLHKFIL